MVFVAVIGNSVEQELAVVELIVPDEVVVSCHGMYLAVEAKLSRVLPLVWRVWNAAEESADVGVMGNVRAVPEEGDVIPSVAERVDTRCQGAHHMLDRGLRRDTR